MDQFQGHEHRAFTYGNNKGGGVVAGRLGTDYQDQTAYLYTDKSYYGDAGNGTPRVGSETRPSNLSIKVWQRIS